MILYGKNAKNGSNLTLLLSQCFLPLEQDDILWVSYSVDKFLTKAIRIKCVKTTTIIYLDWKRK